MSKSVIKYILVNKKGNSIYNNHWEYCRENKIPCIQILKFGTKFWQVEFDVASITMQERFVILNYSDHVIPLYELYCIYSKLPPNKYSAIGGGRNLIFTIFKEDATDIAEKLFDLLVILSKRDQKLFDENPYTINKDGFNSEGFRVEKYLQGLKKMPNKDLINQYEFMKRDNPFKLQTIKMIKDEIDRRKIKTT